AKIIDAFPASAGDPHPFNVKYPLLYLYSVMLAHKVQEEVYSFMPELEYYEDLKEESAINKNLFYSRVSMLYELILKTYTIEALFDHTKETEVYLFSRIFLPVFYRDVLKYIKFAKHTEKTEVTNPNDTFFSEDNLMYLDKLLRPNNSTSNEGAEPNFENNPEIIKKHGCCASFNNSDICGKQVEFLDGNELPIVLFFRILKQTDGIKTSTTSVLRTKTSFILDNSIFNAREIFGFSSTQNFYVLEMYYDSYFAIIRDRKDYCFSVMLNKSLTDQNISNIHIKDVAAVFYERHIHRNKKAFCDNFFISTYFKREDVHYASFYNNFTTQDFPEYITYLALSPVIKNFIFYYHDEKDLDNLSKSHCQKEKCRNKIAFLFLTKRMHYTKEDDDYINHEQPLYIDWMPHKHSNSFIMKEIKELSGIIRFLAAIHLGFKPFMFIDKTFEGENVFRKIKTKTNIDYTSIPTYKRKDHVDVRTLPLFLELENSLKVVLYHAKVDGKNSIIFNIFNFELFSKNIFEMLYNTFYEQDGINARHFKYYLEMDEMIKIISCGNMLCYISDFRDRLSVWFDSYFFREFADLENGLKLKDSSDEKFGEGGIILFLDYVKSFELPFKRVFSSEEIVRKATGEEERIILVNDPILKNKILDKRLYAFGLPMFFGYSMESDKMITIGGSSVMMTYTDRHYHVVIKQNSKNKIKYGIMIDLDGSNKDLYKIMNKIDNNEYYFYYKKSCSNDNNFTAVKNIEEILDINFLRRKSIRDDFIYEVMKNSANQININHFYPQEFYNNYIASNIDKLRIPILVKEFLPERLSQAYLS
ncbi:MAG: hypothetical protein NZZ41_07500, partial [Candidatus Dojkabacteria bacterium]|nr:hypothetical protein [Candidatus Dojkabacteria bacterium]